MSTCLKWKKNSWKFCRNFKCTVQVHQAVWSGICWLISLGIEESFLTVLNLFLTINHRCMGHYNPLKHFMFTNLSTLLQCLKFLHDWCKHFFGSFLVFQTVFLSISCQVKLCQMFSTCSFFFSFQFKPDKAELRVSPEHYIAEWGIKLPTVQPANGCRVHGVVMS